MYAITGISGQIGSVIGRTLLDARQPVRAVLRDGNKRKAWTECGCEEALAPCVIVGERAAEMIRDEHQMGTVAVSRSDALE